MKREIKFRGICNEEIHTHHEATEVGEFVDGYLVSHNTIATKMSCESGGMGSGMVVVYVEVLPETIGQFTGLKDIDGNEIYEGDIVSVVEANESEDIKYEVCYMDAAFVTRQMNCNKAASSDDWLQLLIRFAELNLDIRVIGNVHEKEERSTKAL